MGVRSIPLLQYYAGQRRDLYFLPKERLWLFWQAAFGLMIGSLALIWQMADSTSTSFCCPGLLIYLILMITVWIFLPVLAFQMPPLWVLKFEMEHTAEEIELFLTNGTRMLRRYPKSFRRVISHPVGWELWLMTVIRPVRARESSRQRVK